MKMRICIVLAVVLGSFSAAIGVPVLSGPDTILLNGPPITMTLSGTIDDIYGFEGFVWVNFPASFPPPGHIVSPPDEDDFIAAVGGSDSYIDLSWWSGPLGQGGGVGFGALPDSGETIPVGEWFTFDVTHRPGDQPGEKILVGIMSADLYNVLGVHEVTVVVPEPPIEADVEIKPKTLNLQSKGKWLTCHIWLPEDYNVADIEPNSVLLENEPNDISAEWIWFEEEDEVAMAMFRRSDIQKMLEPGEIELTISGELVNGTSFEGTDVIKVIDKAGQKNMNSNL